MKIFRKTTTAIALFSALLLSSCSNLKNEKQVKLEEFAQAALASAGTNTYNIAQAKGTILTANDKKDTKTNIDTTYKWNSDTSTWEADKEISISLEHVSLDFAKVTAVFSAKGITDPDVRYYVADNGFRIKGNGKATLLGGVIGIETEYIYNEFGYPTKQYLTITGTALVSDTTIQTVETKDIAVTYKTAN